MSALQAQVSDGCTFEALRTRLPKYHFILMFGVILDRIGIHNQAHVIVCNSINIVELEQDTKISRRSM